MRQRKSFPRLVAAILAACSLPALLLAGATSPARARTLQVGPDQAYKTPSAAIAAAHDGDVVDVAPGQYYDCAVIGQNNLTLQGTGPGAVLTDKTCQGKALLVIDGANVTIRNLTLQRARVPDQNGAGIRAEGGSLTVENTRFINDQNGILGADSPEAVIRVSGSTFEDNGVCGQSCAHAIYIGHFKLLRVEHSHFLRTHDGHSIKSRASRTEVVDNDIADGPDGTSSYLIDIPNGGSALIEGNRLEKGPHTGNPANTIMIGEEGVDRPTDSLIVRDNHFTNDQARSTTFVTNITATPVQLSGNVFQGQVRPLAGDGSSR
jgi:hypothetical protein